MLEPKLKKRIDICGFWSPATRKSYVASTEPYTNLGKRDLRRLTAEMLSPELAQQVMSELYQGFMALAECRGDWSLADEAAGPFVQSTSNT